MASAKFTGGSLKIKLPFLDLQGNWEVDDLQRKAAWEIYVELVTRISIVELKPNEGLLREALNSFYSLFSTTREILKKYGPAIATSGNKEDLTLGYVAVSVLNKVIRPLLSKWHPALTHYESTRGELVSITEHEGRLENATLLRDEINKVRVQLIDYANVLGEYAGVNSLLGAMPNPEEE